MRTLFEKLTQKMPHNVFLCLLAFVTNLLIALIANKRLRIQDSKSNFTKTNKIALFKQISGCIRDLLSRYHKTALASYRFVRVETISASGRRRRKSLC